MTAKYHIGEGNLPRPCKANVQECRLGQHGHGNIEEMSKVSEMLFEREYKQNLEGLKKVQKRSEEPFPQQDAPLVETYVHPAGKVITVNPNGSITVTKGGLPATSSATLAQLRAGRGSWKREDAAAGLSPVKTPVKRSSERTLPKGFSQMKVGDEAVVEYITPAHMSFNGGGSHEEKVKIKSINKEDGRIEFEDGTGIYLSGRRWCYGSSNNSIRLKSVKMRDEAQYKNEPKSSTKLKSSIQLKVEKAMKNLPNEKITRENFDEEAFSGHSYDDLQFDTNQRIADLTRRFNGDDERAEGLIERYYETWQNAARVSPPEDGETHVPVRLIPTGTETTQYKVNGYSRVKIASPEKLDDGTVVGRYHDGVQYDYVNPETTFSIVRVKRNPQNVREHAPVASAWKKENQKAAELKELRALINKHNQDFSN